MLLSICIPTYNRAVKLRNTLLFLENEFKSLLCAEQQECELIIRDNCSTDSTFETVSGIVNETPFMHYYRNDRNIGASPNFVQVTKDAEGEYVWWLGDDDTIYDGILKLIIHALNKYRPEILFINHRAGDFSNSNIEFESAISADVKEYYADGKVGVCDIAKCSGVGSLLFMSSRIIKKSSLIESFSGVVFPSGTITLHSAFYAASKGSLSVVKEICIDNDYGEISWKDRQEQIAFKEIPDTLMELKEMGYLDEQVSIIQGSYLTFGRRQQIILYKIKKRNIVLYNLCNSVFSFELLINKLLNKVRNVVK